MGLLVLPLKWLAALGESEDGVGRREGRHLSVGVEEALSGIAMLVVSPQRVQLVISELRHSFDGLQLLLRNLEDQGVRLNVFNATRWDSQTGYDVEKLRHASGLVVHNEIMDWAHRGVLEHTSYLDAIDDMWVLALIHI